MMCQRGRRRYSRSGYTLVEIVVASASATILLAGMTGSISIALKAFDEGDSKAIKAIAAGNVVDNIMAEMRYATRFYERTPHAVTFSVPDRDGDGSEEKFRYAWSGVSGDPLTKELNGSAPSVLLDEVNNLNFTFMTRTVIAPPPPFVPQVVFEEFTEAKLSDPSSVITLPTPNGTAEGDLLIAAVVTNRDTADEISPVAAGWNLVATGVSKANANTLGVWWKLADATEPSSLDVTWQDNFQAYGWIMRFTGHDATNPINASAFSTNTKKSSPTSPAVTTTVSEAMILRLGGFDDDDITVDQPGLTGHTAITMDASNSGNNSVSGGAGYVEQPSTGDSGTSNFSLTSGEESVTVTIAIAPASQ